MTYDKDEMLSRQAVLDALHERLPYPTEACAIVRAMHAARQPIEAPSVPTDMVERVANDIFVAAVREKRPASTGWTPKCSRAPPSNMEEVERERVCTICKATVASYPEGMCCHCTERPWAIKQ